MATLEDRIAALEKAVRKPQEWLMFIDGDRPTPEQAEKIADAERDGRQIIVLIERGQSAWLTGCGMPPPWQ